MGDFQIWIFEVPVNRGSDNRGSTVYPVITKRTEPELGTVSGCMHACQTRTVAGLTFGKQAQLLHA